MKRLITTIVILFSVFTMGFAQTGQGTWLLGGNINISTSGGKFVDESGSQTTTTEFADTFSFALNPDAGYFVGDDFVIGLGTGFQIDNVSGPEDDDPTFRRSIFRIAPFGRYYASLGDKAAFFGQAQLDMRFGSSETEVNNTTTDGPSTTEIDLNIQPGFSIFASDQVAINFYVPAVIGYQYRNSRTEDSNGDVDKTINSGFKVNFDLTGVRFGANFLF